MAFHSQWHHVHSSLQDFSQYFDRSQQRCKFGWFRVFQRFSTPLDPTPYKAFFNRSKPVNYIFYYRYFLFYTLFSSLARSKHSSCFSFSFTFTLRSVGRTKLILQVIFCSLFESIILWPELGNLFVYKIQKNLVHLIFPDGIWFVPKSYRKLVKFHFLTQFPVYYLLYPVVSSLIDLLR